MNATGAVRVAQAGVAYFALVFGTGFALGAIRVTQLVPRLGVRAAELIEMPFMFVAILLAARFVVRRFALPPRAAPRLATGGLALFLLVGAEIALTVALERRPLADSIAGRDPVSGGAYVGMLALFAVMPLLVRRGLAGSTR